MPEEFLKLMEGWDQYVSVRGTQRVSEASLARANDLLTNRMGHPQHRWEYLLKEAVTTSNFPYLLGHIIDREVLSRYKVWVADWKAYFKMARLKNFNVVRRFKVQGQDELLPEVAEKGEYLVRQTLADFYYYNLAKYGAQFDISWESLINDDLGAFDDLPERMANAAIRTEAYNATGTFCSATGPNGNLFGTPKVDIDGANVTNQNTLILTIANLEATLEAMAAQVDALGAPIMCRGVHLVVPTALEFTARQILTSALKQWTEGAVGVPTPYPIANVVSQVGLKLHIDPYLQVIDTSGAGANAQRTWYLFADPSQGAAMEFGYLRGHEAPEICMKASNKVTVGGAAISPFSGDFETDNIFYRVRIVKGSVALDPRFAYSQTGTT